MLGFACASGGFGLVYGAAGCSRRTRDFVASPGRAQLRPRRTGFAALWLPGRRRCCKRCTEAASPGARPRLSPVIASTRPAHHGRPGWAPPPPGSSLEPPPPVSQHRHRRRAANAAIRNRPAPPTPRAQPTSLTRNRLDPAPLTMDARAGRHAPELSPSCPGGYCSFVVARATAMLQTATARAPTPRAQTPSLLRHRLSPPSLTRPRLRRQPGRAQLRARGWGGP